VKKLIIGITCIVIGCLIGVFSALWMSGVTSDHRPKQATTLNINGWETDWALGSKASDPYMRAWVAKHGLLALPKSEAVYFIRGSDDDGKPLIEACTYIISGGAQLSEWWSITLYDDKDYLPMNDDDALSIDKSEMGVGNWSASIQPSSPAGDAPWLSSRNAGAFDLILRLYAPSTAVLETPEDAVNPPHIKRISCLDQSAREDTGT